MRESENAESCVKKNKVKLLRIWWVTRKKISQFFCFSLSTTLSLMFSSETLCWKFKQNQYFPSCQIHKSIFSKAEFSSYHLSWWKLSIFDVKEKVIYSVHILSKQFYFFLNVYARTWNKASLTPCLEPLPRSLVIFMFTYFKKVTVSHIAWVRKLLL